QQTTDDIDEKKLIEDYINSINIPGLSYQPEEEIIISNNHDLEKNVVEESSKENESNIEDENNKALIEIDEDKESNTDNQEGNFDSTKEDNQEDSIESDVNAVFKIDIPDEYEDSTVFEKMDKKLPKAILISKKQGINLRKSCDVQNALFHTLLDSGILDYENMNDEEEENLNFEELQQKIESMMEEANELYRNKKIDEAQQIYEKISELNKKLKTMDYQYVK
ncbi:MAG: hypothetical protein IKE70_03905, partial [Bacilli bacterium]|nr:hypothetical protein [Bacilli bacterium]